ncbi:MAG TPA: long-chain-acyl-CoA synthetase [Rhizomicrobium sp.]|jgi:fatty-acyl-CoA synthase
MDVLSAVSRESVYIASLARTFWRLRHVKPESPVTIVDIVEAWAKRTPDNPAILCGDEVITYRGLSTAADRVAHWAHSLGIARGDCVALLMENRPEFVSTWLGLFKLGAIAGLINTNLRGPALAHSIGLCHARHVVVGSELTREYAEALPFLDGRPVTWIAGGAAADFETLDAALATAPPVPANPEWRAGLTCAQKAFYIFTSGTTGLPKAANISHLRTLYMMHGFAGALGARASDRMYDVLPLYHSAGGICAVGVALTCGGSVVLRRKFSAHEFWDDCVRYQPTFFQYIGELCRYLLNAPASPNERRHHLRGIVGNGLRPEIWQAFQTRFAIPKIVEFYGATEGNVSMMNYDGKVGAVGRIPPYMRGYFAIRIVRFDIEKEMPLRDAHGFCIECADGEVGEAIGKITGEPGRNFEGYTERADTERKILRHVFAEDDAWFRTGDLMREDSLGYFYFVDRVGDTFRWKGENVATSEVAEALSVVDGIREANVYGVSVPGSDGRAGMAALVATAAFDPARLAGQLQGRLPAYARPVFLRLMPEMEITGTFKQRKVELMKDGYDPRRIAAALYVLDPQTLAYRPLDAATYDDIAAGRMKL